MEKIEKNKVKLTFSVDAARFEEGMQYSYNKNKGNIAVQGFRKGKHLENLLKHSMVRQYSMMMQLTLLCQKHTKQQLRKIILM